jgi:hypothetical protein
VVSVAHDRESGKNGVIQCVLACCVFTKSQIKTLVMYSGHPAGLFPSSPSAPRVVVTNGMVVWNYSTTLDYNRMYAMGVSQYGQMTAGSYWLVFVVLCCVCRVLNIVQSAILAHRESCMEPH